VLLLITDEDAPRAVRVGVTLAQPPFTVLFQCVLLETSETSAKVDTTVALKPTSSRKVVQQMFQKIFSAKGGAPTSAVLSHLTLSATSERDKNLKQKLDNLGNEASTEHLGIEHGPGTGAPQDGQTSHPDESVNVYIIHMCTRRKLGRMMVFTICRDVIGQNLYLRVVMHDPVTQKDSHITLLHYTTQRLLNILRISRDMLEERWEFESDKAKQERQQLRAELGKLIVNHLYLQRVVGREGEDEEIDNLEIPDDEEVDYELRMRDIMDPTNSVELSMKRLTAPEASSTREITPDTAGTFNPRAATIGTLSAPPPIQPKTLLDMKEESLIHKAEKVVSGRRVLIAFYNETTPEDVLNHSHNIRIMVACLQTLEVLVYQDFHEDTLEMVCARRGKRHLMSATREHDLVQELWECLALQHSGRSITGITFAGTD